MKNPAGTDTRLLEVVANAQTLNEIQMVMKTNKSSNQIKNFGNELFPKFFSFRLFENQH